MEEAHFILDEKIKRSGIKIHSLPSRVKELERFLEKVVRKQYKRPFEENHDFVGLRVVCLFLSDLPRVASVVRESFTVLSEENRIVGPGLPSFGYMSHHFVVLMKKEYTGPRYDKIKKIPFEIQIRTITMEAWDTISHYLNYPTEADVPEELKRDFYAISGLFFIADMHFETFFKSSDYLRQRLSREFSSIQPPLNQKISLDTLNAYLQTKFPQRAHSDSVDLSSLVRELSKAGIARLSQLDQELGKGLNAFLQYERDNPPFSRRNPERRLKSFSDGGVVRSTLSIVNPIFRQNRLDPGRFKKYERLVVK